MPQSTPERRVRWGVMEAKAMKYLEGRGYSLRSDWEWELPASGHEPTEEELDAVIFLIEEWDFGGIHRGERGGGQ